MKTNQKPKNSFDKIRSIMLLFGIRIQDERSIKAKHDWLRYGVIISWVIQSLGFIFSCLYVAMIFPPYLKREVMYSFFCVGLLINLTFQWKRQELEKAMHEVQKLSLVLNPYGFIGKKSINTSLFIYFAFLFGNLISMIITQTHIAEAAFGSFNFTFPNAQQEYYANKAKKKNFMLSMMSSKPAVYTLNIVFDISLTFCSAVFGLAIILCSNFYEALSNIIISEQKILQKKLSNHAQNPVNLPNEIETLHSISSAVEMVDGVVNLFSLQLYAVFFSALFATISSLTSKESLWSETMMVDISLGAVFGGYLFLKFTNDACRVYEEGKQLKKVGLTYSRLSNNRDIHADLTLLVFLQNIKELNLCVTGGNMFVIERGLILSIGSAMVTYGVLMYQLSGATI